MKIIINGQPREFNAPVDLQAVITVCLADKRLVIAELNGQIIKTPLWAATPVREGDQLELVSFVGGG